MWLGKKDSPGIQVGARSRESRSSKRSSELSRKKTASGSGSALKNCCLLLLLVSLGLLACWPNVLTAAPISQSTQVSTPASSSKSSGSREMRIRLPNNWEPRSYQIPAWTYLENGGKHAELVWHRRAGKDELCLHRTAVAAYERVGNYWHMLPKQNQARRAIWQAVNPHTGKLRIDEAFPRDIRESTNDHEMLIRFRNGASWQVLGSDNFNSLVGSPPVGCVLSEWPLCDPASWGYLRPILLENGGWAIMNGTPRGRNHAYRTLQGALKEQGHFGQVLRASETGVFTAAQLDAEKRQLIQDYGVDYGESMYAQEYDCSFDAANLGAILGRWLTRAKANGRIHADTVFDADGAPVIISSDIGFRDTASWWFWQPRFDGFGMIKYIGESGLDADEWIEKIKETLTAQDYKLGHIYLPHDAKSKTFYARHSPHERFAKEFGWGKVTIVPMTSVSHRINAARRVIDKCHFDEAQTGEGLDGLVEWAFEYNEETKQFSKEPKHNWASHPADAFSYGAMMVEEMKLPEKPVVKPITDFRFGANMTFNELRDSVARSRRAEA